MKTVYYLPKTKVLEVNLVMLIVKNYYIAIRKNDEKFLSAIMKDQTEQNQDNNTYNRKMVEY